MGEKKRRSVAGIDQEELVDPVTLADPDSLFHEFDGVFIHHKVCDGTKHSNRSVELAKPELLGSGNMKEVVSMILLHGFGASVFSWSRVMKPLAHLIGSKVLAFDRPAFGLSSRNMYAELPTSSNSVVASPNPYSRSFSVRAALSFIDLLHSDKTILMGHSAGSIVAMDAYFEAPERIAALIFVAPAIIAPCARAPSSSQKEKGEQSKEFDEKLLPKNPVARFLKGILGLITCFIQLLMRAGLTVRKKAGFFLKKFLAAVLRSSLAIMLVRVVMDKFGIQFVKNAWYDASKVTLHDIQGYTKPLKAKDWEPALLEYTLSMLTDMPLVFTKRLSEISCPVLIVTGDMDRLVPSWNAKRLAAVIPGSTFEVIKNCGHVPHEEKSEEFLSVVDKFLQQVFFSQNEVQMACELP